MIRRRSGARDGAAEGGVARPLAPTHYPVEEGGQVRLSEA